MPDHRLLKSQRNECFVLLKEAGLNPLDFQWVERPSPPEQYSQLVHPSSGYFFWFNRWNPAWSPDRESQLGKAPFSAYAWDGLLTLFKAWTLWVAREPLVPDVPDLWEQYQGGPELGKLSGSAQIENLPLNTDQKRYLFQQLGEIKHFLYKLEDLDDERQIEVDRRFEYLQESMERVGKKDWLLLAMGGLLSLIISGTVSPERANDFLSFASAALLHAFVTTPLLPSK
jgi:hypothetical protein